MSASHIFTSIMFIADCGSDEPPNRVQSVLLQLQETSRAIACSRCILCIESSKPQNGILLYDGERSMHDRARSRAFAPATRRALLTRSFGRARRRRSKKQSFTHECRLFFVTLAPFAHRRPAFFGRQNAVAPPPSISPLAAH